MITEKSMNEHHVGSDPISPRTLTLEQRWVNDWVEVSKEGHARHGQGAQVTVVGVDMPDTMGEGIEVRFHDGGYDCFFPAELLWN